MTGGIVAATAAVASVGIGAYSASQAGSAASAANKNAQTQLGFEQEQFDAQGKYRTQLDQLLADPSSVTKLPSYDFFKKQGEESTARSFAANPSGAEGVALQQYGQNYASQAYQQQVNLLAGLSGLTNNPASYGQVANGAQSNAISGQGQTFEQIQQLLAQGGSALKMFGPGGQFSSAGTPGAGGGSSYSGIYPGYTVTMPGGGPNG